jgi:uncharacterized protein
MENATLKPLSKIVTCVIIAWMAAYLGGCGISRSPHETPASQPATATTIPPPVSSSTLHSPLDVLQEKLIFPGQYTQGRAGAKVTPPPGCQLLTLKTPDGQQVAAIFGPAQTANGGPVADPAHAPTLVFFYGNAMCMKNAMDLFDEYRKLGANVLVPDFLGYGMSSGKASEAGCYATADAVWQWLQSQPGVDGRKIIVTGWSLGAAVAVDLAARQPVAGLATFSGFTSMNALVAHLYPFIPNTLVTLHFNSLEKMPRVTCPIVIGHGIDDDMIPFAMSDQLAAAAKGPIVARIRAPHTRHNDFLDNADEQVIAALTRLVEHAGKPQ